MKTEIALTLAMVSLGLSKLYHDDLVLSVMWDVVALAWFIVAALRLIVHKD